MNELQYNYTEVEEYIKANLKECAGELVQMYQTSILPQGRIREASNMLKSVLHPTECLTNTIRMVEIFSIEHVWKTKC